MNDKELYDDLKQCALRLGAELFGVADLSKEKDKIEIDSEVLPDLNRGICLGVSLNPFIVSAIIELPTRLYSHHYKTTNTFLDILALKVAKYVINKGHRAVAIPASQILDWKKQTAHLSHKRIGYLAGIGWIGRNNLLVNERYGCQFRLVTILTDMPLAVDKPKDLTCAECVSCVKVCPADAIKENCEDFDHISCFEQLKAFQKKIPANQYICGICIKACKGNSKRALP